MAPTAADIIDAVRSQVAVDPARLVPEAELRTLDLTSLDMMSALFEIEDRFGIEVAPEEIAGARTLGDVIERVLAKASG